MVEYLLAPFIAYLLGSVSSAVVVSKLMKLPDPRTTGSKNPGATNVLRVGNKVAATLTLVGDLLKGTFAVVLGRVIDGDAIVLALAGLGVFLGHLYPLYFGFKGGKGVATAFGVYLGLAPWVAGVLLLTWVSVAAVTRYSSLAALVSAALSPVYVVWLIGNWPSVAMSGCIAGFLFVRHRSNIQRLLAGEETRIGQPSDTP